MGTIKWWMAGLLGMMACGDGTQPLAKPGAPVVVVRTDPANTAECPYGGSIISSGLDADGDGVLADDELQQRTVVCNPAPMEPPPTIVVRLVAEPAGAHCSEGGTAVQSGPDNNHNGKLDDDEVSHTAYVCGQQLLSRIVVEPPGAHCIAGGLAFLVGRDRDGDGVLAHDEVEQTEYECGDILARDVTITSQADATALAGIAVIYGNVLVNGAVDTLTLPRLQHLVGSVKVQFTTRLTGFAAPELLDVAGDFTVAENPSLTGLDLPKLQSVAGGFELEEDPGLVDVGGLPALTRIGGDLTIADNAALVSLPTSIRHIGGRLVVGSNPRLTTIEWSLADQLAGAFLAGDNLTSLQIAVVGETANPVLGDVGIVGPHLTSISLEAGDIGSINYQSRGDALTDVIVHAVQIQGDMTLTSASLRHLTLSVPPSLAQPFRIHGSLRLWSPLETLDAGLFGMTVDGVCSLADTRLTDVSAISFASVLEVGGNTGLTTLSGIGLQQVRIIANQTLASVVLPSTTLLGFSEISGNPVLQDISLGGVTGTVVASLEIASNPRLARITGPSLTHIDGQLAIHDNAVLTDVSLDQLVHVSELTVVMNNAALPSFSLPALTSSGGIYVNTNAALHHLAFDALTQPTAMTVVHNHVLPACQVDALFARIPGGHLQEDNDTTASCTAPP